ncbi:hypothetical protein AVEN_41026-1, partial [Araneus ventricosus]
MILAYWGPTTADLPGGIGLGPETLRPQSRITTRPPQERKEIKI